MMKKIALVMTMGSLLGQAGAKEKSSGEVLLKALDRNGDGKLQQEEIDLAVVVLRRMDRDKDGTVTSEEMISSPQDRRPGAAGSDGPQRRFQGFQQMDKNGDGKISKEEAPERMKERFDQMDGNGDGFLDKAEQEELMKRFRERMRQGGDKRPNQGGGRRGEEDPSGGEKPKRPPQAK